MKTYFLSMVFSVYNLTSLAQKPSVDSNTLKNWAYVSQAIISNNGNYAYYSIENQPVGGKTLVVLDTKNKWKLELPGCGSEFFSSDSKYLFFKKGRDSLGIIKTGHGIVKYIPFVQTYEASRDGNATWLTYQLDNSQNTLEVYNLKNGKEKTFNLVKEYLLSEDGNALLFLTEEKKDTVFQTLHLLNLVSGEKKTIWQGTEAGNFIFNKNNKQIAFTVERPSGKQTEKTFWYYQTGMDKAIELAINWPVENDSTLQLQSVVSFSADDSCLFVTVKRKASSPKPSPSLVKVWGYSDLTLQSKQLNRNDYKTYQAVINLHDSHLVRLENENEMLSSPLFTESENYWRLIVKRPGEPEEEFWNVKASISVSLECIKDGRRKVIPGLDNLSGNISPNGKYVIYYDSTQGNYFSYETESGAARNLTKGIQSNWTGYTQDAPNLIHNIRGIAGWLKDGEGVLIYDHNDIWQIDMAGKKMPVNITGGYGKRHNIVFSMGLVDYRGRVLSENERLILNAFNTENKDNGYFSKTLSKPGDPELLCMGPYLYNIPDDPDIPSGAANYIPSKASQGEVYLVQRMRANEAPNIFSTRDFKTFTQLSDLHPEKNYNWLTSELVIWKALDGDSLQGILYKPENFDPQKKYPVIFNYYERKSDGLHAFLQPDISMTDINVPWYVSNGYLVFQPDIHYKIGETGNSVLNSLVSAAQYLSKLRYVDSKKMGLSGHSFGAYETNFLVAHTNLFAAACSASGVSDLVSDYGGLYGNGGSLQDIVEFRQFRIGAALWQRPDLYIKNSPVFAADKVTTPLLMMHTPQDGVCPFANAIEFFTALRRLGKKVWMLQYEGNHWPQEETAQQDFSTRMQQFFDHYLKDAPAPNWMINVVPEKMKGIETGMGSLQK